MKYLKKLITQHIDIKKDEWDEITSRFEKVFFKRGTLISSAGDIFSDFLFYQKRFSKIIFY